MRQTSTLTHADLIRIDQQFTKAGHVLAEARTYVDRYDPDLAVRRSQEAFELYLKTLCRFLQRDYQATHDLEKHIYDLAGTLKEYLITPDQVARLALANSVLDLWRSPAFYGDEKLKIGGVFNLAEAKLAITYAELGQFVCTVVRDRCYRECFAVS